MTATRRRAWTRLAPALVASAVVAATYAVHRTDADSYWHLATGRWIWENGSIPRTDPFSYTMQGQPWECVNWLSQALLYGTWRIAGDAGLVMLGACAAFATLALLALALNEFRIPPRWSVAVVVVVGLMLQVRMSMIRPLALAAPLLACCVWLLARRWCRRDRSWWFAPLILAAWLAAHPGAILLPVMAFALVAAGVAAGRGARFVVSDAVVAAACVTVFALSRSGPESLRHATEIATLASPIVEQTAEWQLAWTSSAELALPFGLIVAAVVCGAFRALRQPLTLGLGLMAFLLANRFGRNCYEALILVAPLAAQQLRLLDLTALRHAPRRLRRWLPAAVVIGILGLHAGIAGERAFNLNFGIAPDTSFFPDDVTDTLLTLPAGRTIHDFGMGGFLAWRRIPGGVFADGRNLSLYTPEFLATQYAPLSEGVARVDEIADRWDVHYAIIRRSEPFGLNLMTSDTWVPVRHGRVTSLFVRSARAQALEAQGIPTLHLLRFVDNDAWMRAWYGGILANPVRKARLRQEIVQSHATYGSDPVMGRALRVLRGLDVAWTDALLDEIAPQ